MPVLDVEVVNFINNDIDKVMYSQANWQAENQVTGKIWIFQCYFVYQNL